MADILVLGATGYSGRLVTQYLLEHPQSTKFTFAIGVRSRQKLLSFFPDLPASVPVYELDVTDEAEVDAAVRKVKVVVSTVGPYWRYGTPVVKACAEHGVHYVDITGETAWIYEIIRTYDYLASKTHAIIVPSCGFDSIPSDIAVHLSNKTLKALAPSSSSDIGSSTTAVYFKGGIGAGSFQTAITFIEDVPESKKAFISRDWCLSPVTGVVSPPNRLVWTLPHSTPSISGGFFIMRDANRAIVQRTAGLLEYQAQSSSFDRKELQPYGTRFTYDEFLVQSNLISSVVLTLGFALSGFCLAFFAPARWLFKRLIPSTGTGPSPDTLKNGFMKYINITSSTSTPGTPPTLVRTVIKGDGDPGLTLTAIMLVESALCLLTTPVAELPPLARKGGILTPMTAMGDALVERLKETGKFAFESEVLVGSQS
ncbi:NAD-P-binding protein [Dentipellis sp. KUC8613]|nr:NAD-P-binding protein [Dentipellis sp. KUC8613]